MSPPTTFTFLSASIPEKKIRIPYNLNAPRTAVCGVQESLFLMGELDFCKVFPLILLRLLKISLYLTVILINIEYVSITSELPEQRARLPSVLLSFVPECGRKFQK